MIIPSNKCLHELFEAQELRTPEAVAVVCEGRALSYGELNRRANQLAHYLRKRGVGPDTGVGVCMERTADLVVALLGILKAGGAYVPTDPAYPRERLGYILEDSQVGILLTEDPIAKVLPNFPGTFVCLDKVRSELAVESEENPASGVMPCCIAYILFTSGSTGRPKGVAIEHRAAVNFLHWAVRAFTRQELAGVLCSTSICFDLSVFEIFATLSAGGKIIMAPNVLHLTKGGELAGVTLINTVPSAMAELVRMGAVPASVKTVNLAGEALADWLVEKIYQTTEADKVYNLYGPSETTTYSTCTLVPRGSSVTIGKPIANTRCYVLDGDRNPVPIGVKGELYLGGVGLARGYYRQPELTAERFLRDPFSRDPNARLYRTGDLCRWLANGTIEYLGRADFQVKIRGFRIELGEIESALREHVDVHEVLVMAREDARGDKRLLAYVVPAENRACTTKELRDYLKEKLPDYMIPAAWVVLPALPLTPNGKLDRKKLPAPDADAHFRSVYEAPRGVNEARLARLWAEVLKLERVGRHDNFFDLGGHSLRATQLLSRIRGALGVDVPLRQLFEMPTVAEFAEYIETIRWTAEELPSRGVAPSTYRDEGAL